MRMMARLRPGVAPAQAQQALSGTFAAVVKQTVGNVDPRSGSRCSISCPRAALADTTSNIAHRCKS